MSPKRRLHTASLYWSNGCEYHSDCFSCPFAKCIEEMTTFEIRQIRGGRKATWLNQQLQVYLDQGMSRRQAIISLTKHMGLKNPNNIYRTLARYEPVPLQAAAQT